MESVLRVFFSSQQIGGYISFSTSRLSCRLSRELLRSGQYDRTPANGDPLSGKDSETCRTPLWGPYIQYIRPRLVCGRHMATETCLGSVCKSSSPLGLWAEGDIYTIPSGRRCTLSSIQSLSTVAATVHPCRDDGLSKKLGTKGFSSRLWVPPLNRPRLAKYGMPSP